MSTLIFGCGYLGSRVARRLVEKGERVQAVTRSAAKARQLEDLGCQPVVADVTERASLKTLPHAQRVLFAVGYDRGGGQSIAEVYAGGVSAVLSALDQNARRFVYISSTGVYSQSHDQWVDEDSPTEPTRPGGQACLAAEQSIAAHPLAGRAVILRLAGIYGPDRVPYLDAIRAGEPIPAPADGYLNLIHVEDAARLAVAALDPATPPGLYCVSDGHPVQRKEYYAQVARCLGAPPPGFGEPGDSAAAARAAASKRVSSEKMSAAFGLDLSFPSYREGLAAILDEPAGPLPGSGALP